MSLLLIVNRFELHMDLTLYKIKTLLLLVFTFKMKNSYYSDSNFERGIARAREIGRMYFLNFILTSIDFLHCKHP